MKLRSTLTAGIALLAASVMALPASAYDDYEDGGPYFDYARVVDVKPVYRVVRVNHPERECWDEPVVYEERGHRSKTPVVVGGIIGGVVGSKIGKGTGRDIATVAGTILGASIGNDISHDQRRRGRRHVDYEQVCRVVDRYVEEEQLEGYEVTYRYHGHTYVTHTDRDPGKRLRVRVSVTPVQ